MVDELLPIESRPRPLRSMFLDLNAYFASVEQQEDPSLRGRPIAVVPTLGDNTSVIAASYEAKKFGVKCGTRVGDAKLMCPDILLIKGQHAAYAAYHRRIKDVAETVLPVDKVCSIDEMRFRLLGCEASPEEATKIARRMKQAIQEGVGECMTCSIGVAPNHFLSKLATDLQKPDGLVIIEAKDLPHRLFGLKLTEFCGISHRMKIRLNAAGIFTSDQMMMASRDELLRAFGSILGERYWYNLRGFEMAEDVSDQKTLGHSHVLPPNLRTEEACREVILRLLHKAAARLRTTDFWATTMHVRVRGMKASWDASTSLPPTQDSITMTKEFLRLWETRSFERPLQVGVTFTRLLKSEFVTPSLFDETVELSMFSGAMDKVNQRFGKHSVYLAGMDNARSAGDEKIAFQKVELFSEGAGDHAWNNGAWTDDVPYNGERIDTFRGL